MALSRSVSWSWKWLPIAARSTSWWSHVELGPPDNIFGLVEAFNKDPRPEKVNLAIGAYRDNDGKPWVLPTVRTAEKRLLDRALDKEYAGIMGYEAFRKLAIELALGKDAEPIKNKQFVTAQSISGTGSLSLAATFLRKFFPNEKVMYLPKPSWGNHAQVFRSCGLDVKTYRYYDSKTCGLDQAGMYEDLKNLPERSAVLLHACAHNPTGVDPSPQQWAEISQICKDKNHFLLVDMAYQGFATGDLDRDAAGLRKLVEDGHKVALCQSFAKNMGLYGERVGAFTILCDSESEVKAVESQVKICVRPSYSNPPINGARIAVELLTDPELHAEWLKELKTMANRIMDMRAQLKAGLIREGSQRDWSHVTNQIGMFCFSGMNLEQVEKLQKEHAIFMTKDGRISMVSLSSHNVDYVAKAIHQVTK